MVVIPGRAYYLSGGKPTLVPPAYTDPRPEALSRPFGHPVDD